MVKVYRNIATPILFFGLELVDCMGVFGVFLGAFYLSDHLLLNLLIVAGAYFSVRLLKNGKPAGYTLCLIKFLMGPEEEHVRLEATLHEPR
jgi:hypothetical protein